MSKEKVKKTRPKKKFSFWRTLSYVGCYVLVTFAVAFVVVATNSSTYSFTPPSLDDGGSVESSLLGNMVSNVMSVEDMTTSLGLTIKNGDTNITIGGDVKLKIFEEFSGVEAKADLSIDYNGTTFDTQILYTDKLYLTVSGRTFEFDPNNGLEGLFGVLQLLGVDIDLDLDNLMSGLDMSILDTLGDYITESTLDDGYALTFDYNGLSATVVLDKEYNIVSVSAPELNIDGWEMGLNLNVDCTNQGIVFDKVDTDISISPLLRLVKCGLNTFKDKHFVAKTNINYDKYGLDFDILVDGSDARLLTNINGQNLSFYLKDGVGYGDFGVVKIKGGAGDINKVLDIVTDLIPDNAMPKLDFNLDIDSVLGLVQKAIAQNWNIVGDDNRLVFSYGKHSVNVSYFDDKISEVSFDICGVNGVVQIVQSGYEVVVPAQQYMQVGDLADFIKPIYNIVCLDRINAQADICIDDKTYNFAVMYDKATGRVSAKTNIYNKIVVFDYADGMLYVQIDDVKVCTPTSDVWGLVIYILQNYCGGIDLDQFKSILDYKLTLDVVQNKYCFSLGSTNIEVCISNDEIVRAKIISNEGLADVEFVYNDQTPLDNIQKDNYTALDVSCENLKYIASLVKDYVESGRYNFDFDFEYDQYSVGGYVGYNDNQFTADVTLSLLGYDIRVVVSDLIGRVYINNIAVSCEYDTLAGVLKYVFDALQLNIDLDKYLAMLPQFDDETLEQFLNDVTLSYVGDTFVLEYKDVTLNVRLGLNKIKSIFANWNDVCVNIAPTYIHNIVVPNVEHIYIEDMIDILESIKPIIQNKYLTANFVISIDNIDVSGKIVFDYVDTRLGATLNVLGKTINIDYIDGKVYFTYDGLKLVCSTNDIFDLIDGYIDIKSKTSNIKSNDNTTDNILDKLALLSIVKTQNGFDITYDNYTFKLTLSDDILSGLAYGDNVNITFDHNTPVFESIDESKYQYVDLTYDNVSSLIKQVKTYINSKEYYINLSATYGEYYVSGWVGLERGHIVGRLESTILGKLLQIDIVEDVVYIDYDGLKLQCALSDYAKIADLLQSEWNITVPDLDLVTPLTMLNTDTNITLDDLQKILNEITISNTGMMFEVEYNGVMAKLDLTNYKLNSIDIAYDGLRAVVRPTTKHTNNVSGEYIDIGSLTNVVKAVNKSMANMTMSGILKVDIVFANEVNSLDINYGITFQNSDLRLYANFTFKGLNVNVYYFDRTIYLDVVGMKFYIGVDDYKDIIGWLNSTFGLNINIDDIENNKNLSFEDIRLDFIKSWNITDDYISANIFDNIHLDVYYNDTIEKVVFESGNKGATIVCTSFDTLTFDSIDKSEYSKYTVVTNTIDDILSTIKKKSFDISAVARVFENNQITYNANVGLVFDFANHFKAYGEANVENVLDSNGSVNFIASWDKFDADDNRDYVFVSYNGMKLRMNNDSLKEILALGLQLLGIDPSVIGFLEDVSDDFKVDSSNLNNIMPNLDMGNPLNMLKYIKSLNLKNSQFTLMLDGSFFGDGVADMEIVLHTNYGTITGLDLNNIYVGGTETFNLAISLNQFSSVPEVQDKTNYMDLSGASELLKAIINTSSKKSYHITGAVKLNALDLIKKTVGVDMGVVIGDDGKTTIDVTLSNYPLYLGVNTAYSNYGAPINRMRTINMRIKGGYAYLRMYDEKYLTAGTYDRMTKVPVSYLIQNLSYYMQYILGFTDTIQSAIDEAITASQNYTGSTDYSNILLDYHLSNSKHTLKLNLQELAHNDQLDTMEIGLTTVNSRETGRKDMLYRLDMNVIMLGDMIKIVTDDEANLKLVDLNNTYDMTSANEFIQNYDNGGYVTFGEYVSESGKVYSKSNDNDATITFYDQNNVATVVSGKIGSLINYPSINQTLTDGRKFKGWYYYANSNKTKLKEWTHSNMPLNSIELYGVWENTYTVTLLDNDQTYMTYSLFKGEKLHLPDIEDQFVETDGVRTGQEFVGWYDGILKRDDISVKTDVTLKSRWADATYYQITYIDGDQITYKWVKEGSEVETSSKPNYIGTYEDTQVVFDWRGWYNGDTEVVNFVAESPMTLVAKWEPCSMDMARTLTIKDGEQVLSSTPQLVGYNINVPKIDKINYDTWYYLDAELTERYYISTMPEYDLTLYVSNMYTITIKYMESITNGVTKTNTITKEVRQGTNVVDLYPDVNRLNTHGTGGQVVNIYDDTTNKTKETTYMFVGYIDYIGVMPNSDVVVEEEWAKTERYYYDIVFDTEYRYNPLLVTAGACYKTQPNFTPSTLRVLEGNTIDLSGAEYKPSCEIYKTAFKAGSYKFKCSGWGTTEPNEASNGGGNTSYTVNSADATSGQITLYVYWERQ